MFKPWKHTNDSTNSVTGPHSANLGAIPGVVSSYSNKSDKQLAREVAGKSHRLAIEHEVRQELREDKEFSQTITAMEDDYHDDRNDIRLVKSDRQLAKEIAEKKYLWEFERRVSKRLRDRQAKGFLS